MYNKKIIIALFLILFVNHLFAEGFSIIESTLGTKYSFEIKKGFLVKEGTISIKDRKIHTVFVLDTGSCSSSYDSIEENDEVIEFIEKNNFAYITLKKASGKKVRFKIKKFVL